MPQVFILFFVSISTLFQHQYEPAKIGITTTRGPLMDNQLDLTGRPARLDGAYRGKRIAWQDYPSLSSRTGATASTVMIEFAPNCFAAEGTRAAMKGGAQYIRPAGTDSTLEIPEGAALRAIRPANDNEPAPAPEYWLGRLCRFPSSYTGRKAWKVPPRAANDNRPARLADEERRVEELLASDRRYRRLRPIVTAYQPESRILRALLNDAAGEEGKPETADDDAARAVIALRQIAEMLRPAELVAANDNQLVDDGETEESRAHGLERHHNQGTFSPSIPKLRRAYADGMRARCGRTADGREWRVGPQAWSDKRGSSTVWLGGWEGRRFIGLLFISGRLEFYGDKGRKRRADYKTRVAIADPKTKEQIEAEIAHQGELDLAYLSLPSANMPDCTPPTDAPRGWPPLPSRSATVAANLLHGLSRPPVRRCPIGIAWQYGRLAGVSAPIGAGAGKTSAPAHAVHHEIDRGTIAANLEERASDAVEIVRQVLAGDSYREIGVAAGYAPASAHVSGKRAVFRAVDEIISTMAA